MIASANITLVDVNDGLDASSYIIRASMTGTPDGNLTINVYKDGSLYTQSIYVQIRQFDGSSWSNSGLSGTTTTGLISGNYTGVKAFEINVWADITMTEMFSSAYISHGDSGSAGKNGSNYVIAETSTALSFTLANWQIYATKNRDNVWNNISNVSSIKVGDTLAIPGVISDKQNASILLMSVVKSISGSSVTSTSNGSLIYGLDGADGKGITSITPWYALSSSTSTVTGTWSTNIPTLTVLNKYLWSYNYIVYSDGSHSGSSDNAVIIGTYGDSVTVTSISYGISDSAGVQPSTWQQNVPVVQSGQYLWTRTTYSDGNNLYQYSYQAEDGTSVASFVETIDYNTSDYSSYLDEMTATEDQSPQAGKTYYTLDNGSYNLFTGTEFVSGVTYYEDESIWYKSAGDIWYKGQHLWARKTRYYSDGTENSPYIFYDKTTEDILLKSCEFVVLPTSYNWIYNKRRTDKNEILFKSTIKGYDINSTYNLTIKDESGIPVLDNLIDAVNQLIRIPYIYYKNKLIFTATIEYFDKDINPSSPQSDSCEFSLTPIETTEKETYLGLLNSMPTHFNEESLIEGDHFVASVPVTYNGITYAAYKPLVYSNGSWNYATSENCGEVGFGQVLYDCVKDIYDHADWQYVLSSDSFDASQTYYRQISLDEYESVELNSSTYQPNIYFIKKLNIPESVKEDYNYQFRIISSFVGAHEIELVNEITADGEVRAGSIHSSGYKKGTIKNIIDNHDGDSSGFKKGFHGDNDGSFEAFAAWFLKAYIYNSEIYDAIITGSLKAETFQTNATPVDADETYTSKTLTSGYWLGEEAVSNALTLISSENYNKPVGLKTKYNTSTRNTGMYVVNNTISNQITLTPGQTWTAPYPTKVEVTEGGVEYSSQPVSGVVAKGTVITNTSTYNISIFYENTSLDENKIYSGTNLGSYSGSTVTKLCRCTNTAVSNIETLYYSPSSNPAHSGNDFQYSLTITKTGTFGGSVGQVAKPSYLCAGSIYYKKNGTTFQTVNFSNGPNYYPSHTITSVSVVPGDIISQEIVFTFFRQSKDIISSNPVTWTLTYTPSNNGINAIGFWVYTGQSWTNLGTNLTYNHNINPLEITDPVSINSGSNLANASFIYDLSQFQNGLNLLNDTTYQSEIVINQANEYASTISLIIYNSNNTAIYTSSLNLYYRFNGIQKSNGTVTSDVQTGQIFKFDNTPSGSVQRKEDSSAITLNRITSIIWTNETLTITHNDGEVISIIASTWLVSLSLTFKPAKRERGNFTESIYPETNSGTSRRRITNDKTPIGGKTYYTLSGTTWTAYTSLSSFTSGVDYYEDYEINFGSTDARIDNAYIDNLTYKKGNNLSTLIDLETRANSYTDEKISQIQINTISNSTINNLFV